MDLERMGRDVLARQPFAQMLGLEVANAAPGRIELTLPVTERLTQHHGYVHGGALSAAADTGLTYAGATVLGEVLTSEFKINFLRPAKGARLAIRAEVLSHGRRQAVCRCEIYAVSDGTETLVAAAQGTIVRIEPRDGVAQ